MTTATLPAGTEILGRENRYAARCVLCGGHVAPAAGNLARQNGRWAAAHLDDECDTAPAPAAATRELVARDGIYRTDDGTIYKVQEARQGTGRLYAKRLTIATCLDEACGHPTVTDDLGSHSHGHFTYAPGAIHTLTAEMRLTDDQAARYGTFYGICICCGADLTDENSIARGLGPICAGKYF